MFGFRDLWTQKTAGTYEEQIARLRSALDECDAVVIGARLRPFFIGDSYENPGSGLPEYATKTGRSSRRRC